MGRKEMMDTMHQVSVMMGYMDNIIKDMSVRMMDMSKVMKKDKVTEKDMKTINDKMQKL
jgi:hypothetical protein